MTQPICLHHIPTYATSRESVNLTINKITLLAISTIASIVSAAILPWQLSIPLSTLFLGSALFYCGYNNRNSTPIYHTQPQPIVVDEHPLIVERVPTPIFISPPLITPRTPPVHYVSRNPYPLPELNRNFFDQSYHAPVGTGEFSRRFHINQFTPPPTSFNDPRSHAPVGTGELSRHPLMSQFTPSPTSFNDPRSHAPVGTGERSRQTCTFPHNRVEPIPTPSNDFLNAPRAPVGHR